MDYGGGTRKPAWTRLFDIAPVGPQAGEQGGGVGAAAHGQAFAPVGTCVIIYGCLQIFVFAEAVVGGRVEVAQIPAGGAFAVPGFGETMRVAPQDESALVDGAGVIAELGDDGHEHPCVEAEGGGWGGRGGGLSGEKGWG